MKRMISVILVCVIFLCSCTNQQDTTVAVNNETSTKDSSVDSVSDQTAVESKDFDEQVDHNDEIESSKVVSSVSEKDNIGKKEETTKESANNFDIKVNGLDDEALLRYVEDNVYATLVNQLDSDEFFVENVEAVYYPKEYIEALASNSQSNVYFGYTSDELNKHFQGTKYVFTLGEDGQTIVVPMETVSSDVYVKAMENVIIGTGVILVCVTVSVLAMPAAPAVGMIFAASASTGTVFALESGAISFAAAAIAKGYETENFEQAIEAGVEAGGNGFKWGAIIGATTGGGKELLALRGATLNGLSMNEAAKIQRESGFPLDVIKEFSSMEQYQVCKDAGLTPKMVDGKLALVREIDLFNNVDEMGRTNAQRILEGLSPLDPSGTPYELHHIGQKTDSTLAILTKAEHRIGDNYKIWHEVVEAGEGVHAQMGGTWNVQKQQFWEKYLELATKGGVN